MAERRYWEALRDTIAEEMRARPSILLMEMAEARTPSLRRMDAPAGRRAHKTEPLTGPDSVPLFRALRKEFGERVRRVPAETRSLIGAAVGAALSGCQTVVHVDASEVPIALSELANAMRANLAMGPDAPLPIVIRAHLNGSMPVHPLPMANLNCTLAVPATPAESCGLLRTALRSESRPVLLFEDPALSTASVNGDSTAAIPFGSAAVLRNGKDLTLVTYGCSILAAQTACEQCCAQHGIDVELIDLRSLKPLDFATVAESLKKTGRFLLCSPAIRGSDFLSDVASRVGEEAFDELDAPVRWVCARPNSNDSGAQQAPTASEIAAAIRALARE